MRAILLAAGVGRRFPGAFPKPLKRLYGQQTVLGYSAKMLFSMGLHVTIVIGHGAHHFLPLFGGLASFVYNRGYALHEWMTSAKLAMRLLPEESYLLGCADTLIREPTVHQLLNRPDSVLLVPCTPEEGYYRVRTSGGRMLETEPERYSDGDWPDLTWGGWGHVGPLARKALFRFCPETIQHELPAHMFNGCQVIVGKSYNINTLEDLEVARKAF